MQFVAALKKGLTVPVDLDIISDLGADANAMKAYNLAAANNLDGAIAASKANAQSHPKDWTYLHNLAIYLAAAGQWDESVCAIRKANDVFRGQLLPRHGKKLDRTYSLLHMLRTGVRGDDKIPVPDVVPLKCPP